MLSTVGSVLTGLLDITVRLIFKVVLAVVLILFACLAIIFGCATLLTSVTG